MRSAYIRVKEVRGQVPGTTCNGARTNSAINNTQNSGYVRAPEYYAVHWGSGAPGLRHQAPRAVVPVLRTWPIGQVALAYRRYRGRPEDTAAVHAHSAHRCTLLSSHSSLHQWSKIACRANAASPLQRFRCSYYWEHHFQIACAKNE